MQKDAGSQPKQQRPIIAGARTFYPLGGLRLGRADNSVRAPSQRENCCNRNWQLLAEGRTSCLPVPVTLSRQFSRPELGKVRGTERPVNLQTKRLPYPP